MYTHMKQQIKSKPSEHLDNRFKVKQADGSKSNMQ